MATWYQQGIAARKAGILRHENPYVRSPTFWEYFLELDGGVENRNKKRDWWFSGWDAHDRVSKTTDVVDAARWRYFISNVNGILISTSCMPGGTNKENLIKYLDERRDVV